MLKLGRVIKVNVLFLVLVFVFNSDLFKFSAAILEKGLLVTPLPDNVTCYARTERLFKIKETKGEGVVKSMRNKLSVPSCPH